MDIDKDLLENALYAKAQGDPAAEAAVLLLCRLNEDLPVQWAALDLLDLDYQDSNVPIRAAVKWSEVMALATTEEAQLSDTERRMVRLCASLGGGGPVDLAETVRGLHRRTLDLLLAALAHADQDKDAHAWPAWEDS